MTELKNDIDGIEGPWTTREECMQKIMPTLIAFYPLDPRDLATDLNKVDETTLIAIHDALAGEIL
jgi:hypothetical protein